MENNFQLPKTLFNIPIRSAVEIISDILSYVAFNSQANLISDGGVASWLSKKYKGAELAFGLFTLGRLSAEHIVRGETKETLSAVQECMNMRKENLFISQDELKNFILQNKFARILSRSVEIEGLDELLKDA